MSNFLISSRRVFPGVSFFIPYICRVFSELVKNAIGDMPTAVENSLFLSHILDAEEVDELDKIVTLIHLVAAGIETVTFII